MLRSPQGSAAAVGARCSRIHRHSCFHSTSTSSSSSSSNTQQVEWLIAHTSRRSHPSVSVLLSSRIATTHEPLLRPSATHGAALLRLWKGHNSIGALAGRWQAVDVVQRRRAHSGGVDWNQGGGWSTDVSSKMRSPRRISARPAVPSHCDSRDGVDRLPLTHEQRVEVWRYAARKFFDFRRQGNWRAALAELDNLDRRARIVEKQPVRDGIQVGPGGARRRQGEGVGKWESGVEQVHTAYNLAMDTLAKVGRWSDAFGLVGTMRERGLKVDTIKLNIVLKACSTAKQCDAALRLLTEMRDPRNPLASPDVISCNTTLTALARAGRTEEALSLLDEMWRFPLENQKNPGVPATIKPLLAPDGSDDGSRLSADTCRSSSSDVSQDGNRYWKMSPEDERYWRMTNEGASGGGGGEAGMGATSGHRLGRKEEGTAMTPVGDMSHEGEERERLDSEADTKRGESEAKQSETEHYVGHDERPKAQKQEQMMHDPATVDLDLLKPLPAPTLNSFNAAICACIPNEETPRRLCRADEGDDDGGGEEGSGIDAGKRAEMGFLILQAMRRGDGGAPAPDIMSYKEVVTACGRAGQWERALSVIEFLHIDGGKPTPQLYFAGINALGQSGQWERALSLLREDMPAAGILPAKQCLNAAIRACGRAGMVLEALRILYVDFPMSRLKSDFPIGTRNGPDALSFGPILEAAAQQGDKDLATGLLRDIRPYTGYLPSKHHYRNVVAAFLNHGDEDGARGIVAEFHAASREKYGASSSRNVSASAGREGGRRGEAPAGFNLAELARTEAFSGNWTACMELLKEAKFEAGVATDAARRMKNASVREARSEEAAWWEVVIGQEEAKTVAQNALSALKDCYEIAIETLGRRGRWKQAFELLAEASSRLDLSLEVRLDPSCFAPALRASSMVLLPAKGHFVRDQVAASAGQSSGPRPHHACITQPNASAKQCLALLREMETGAGVMPNARCVNVVIKACARAGAWEEVIQLFEEMNHSEKESAASHNPKSQSRVRPLRSSQANFANTMAPTSASYYYAIQACRGQIERLQEELATESGDGTHRKEESGNAEVSGVNGQVVAAAVATQSNEDRRLEAEGWAQHAVTLIRKMNKAHLFVPLETVEVVEDSCVKAGMWTLATEVNRLFPSWSSGAVVGRKSSGMIPQEEEDEVETNLREHGARAAAEATLYGRSLRFEEEQHYS